MGCICVVIKPTKSEFCSTKCEGTYQNPQCFHDCVMDEHECTMMENVFQDLKNVDA